MAKSNVTALKSAGESNPSVIEKTFVLERETKGAVRYAECGANGKPLVPEGSRDSLDEKGGVVGAIYLRKKALGGRVPQRIVVMIRLPE